MLDNNYKVLVMGNNFDKSIEKIKKLDFKDKKENVLFLMNCLTIMPLGTKYMLLTIHWDT